MDYSRGTPDGRQLTAPWRHAHRRAPRRARRRDPAASKGKRCGRKGPTPPAEARTGHPAARRAAVQRRETTAADAAAAAPGRASGGRDGKPQRRAREVVVWSQQRASRRCGRGSRRRRCTSLSASTSDDRVREAIKTRGRTAACRCSRRRAPSSTGSAPARSTRGSRCRCRRTTTRTPDDLLAARPRLRRGAAAGGARRRHRPAQPRCRGAVGGRLRRPRRARARSAARPAMTAGAWKASAGAAARVPVARATNLTRALRA